MNVYNKHKKYIKPYSSLYFKPFHWEEWKTLFMIYMMLKNHFIRATSPISLSRNLFLCELYFFLTKLILLSCFSIKEKNCFHQYNKNIYIFAIVVAQLARAGGMCKCGECGKYLSHSHWTILIKPLPTLK